MVHSKNIKLFIIVFVVTLLPLSSVMAAPIQQNTAIQAPVPSGPVIGIVNLIEIQGDPTLDTTIVLVTLTTLDGIARTVQMTLKAATTLGLVITNPGGIIVPNETFYGLEISIDPTLIITEVDNKVAITISDFLGTLFATDAATIMGYHEQGMGFGVIAQAGFMAFALGGDGTMMDAILMAKQSGDFSTIILSDGTTVENWGQLRKAVLTEDKSLKNLGAIMSGRATETPKEHGKPEGENGKPDPKDKPDKKK